MNADEIFKLISTGGGLAVMSIVLTLLLTGKLHTDGEFQAVVKRCELAEQTGAAFKSLAERSTSGNELIAAALMRAIPSQEQRP